MDALTPQPAQGVTKDLKSLDRPKVMIELTAFCCYGSGFRSTTHVDDILFTVKGCMASFYKHTDSFVFPVCSQFGQK